MAEEPSFDPKKQTDPAAQENTGREIDDESPEGPQASQDIYGYSTPFTPSLEVLRRSRKALRTYHLEYKPPEDETEKPYPWRLVVARHTGLPALLRGFLPPQDVFENRDVLNLNTVVQETKTRSDRPKATQDGVDTIGDISDRWLFGDETRAEALFGIGAQEAWERLWREESHGSQILYTRAPSNGSRTPKMSAHVRYQQWHRDWPVFGGGAIVHMASGDRRACVTTSYFPLQADKDFVPKIEPHEAVHAAREALADFMRENQAPIDDALEGPADIVPYAGKQLSVLPHAGGYHLAYPVELLSPHWDSGWRVFIDAETGEPIGDPEDLILHVDHFATSGAALSGFRTSKPLPHNPCSDFMCVGIHSGTGNPEDDDEPSWCHAESQGPQFEATNVAIHAHRVYERFVALSPTYQSRLQSYEHNGQTMAPALRARAAFISASPYLQMGFNRSKLLARKVITFQSDTHDGLRAENEQLVHHPAYDPEVICHEVTHALMWLLNPKPFEEMVSSVPFGCSLVEGYANYFARSIAQPSDPSPLWARAAYQVDPWCDRWALTRSKWIEGEDLLPAPNLYPHQKTNEELPAYNVGMIWARALWDLRTWLGKDVADRLALGAWEYLHGWVASFESAAEGFIDAAIQTGIPTQPIKQIFAERGILAEQSIQALAYLSPGNGSSSTVLLAGADAGLMRSLDNGETWHDWGDTATEPLRDVVALTEKDSTFYAATETGIYQRNSDGAAWTAVGAWPEDQTPYSVAKAENALYAGAGFSVWRYCLAGGGAGWVPSECTTFINGTACADCGNTDTCLFNFLGLELASTDEAANALLYCAGFDAIRYRAAAGRTWLKKFIGQVSQPAAVVALAARGDTAYLGTLADGIYAMQIAMPVQVNPIARPDQLGGSAVLSLHLTESDELIAGTTSGVYKAALAPVEDYWNWSPLNTGLPSTAIVTIVLSAGTVLWAGTAAHGLWSWDGATWTQAQGIASLTGGV